MKSQAQRDSQRQEKDLAMDLGGRVQKASGALAYAKGDVRVLGKTRVRAEAKCTVRDWYALSYRVVEKIENEALNGGDDLWVLQLRFQGTPSQFAVCDYQWFMQCRSGVPGDVAPETYITVKKSVRLSRPGLLKLMAESYNNKTEPHLVVKFEREPTWKWVSVIPWHLYLQTYGIYNESNS